MFWEERQKGEGAYFAITAPDRKDVSTENIPEPPELEEKWFNVDYRVNETLSRIENTYYAGDALPTASVNFGPANLAGVIGAKYKLMKDTIFFDIDPPIRSWDNLPEFHLKKNGRLYQAIRQTLRELARLAEGRYFVAVTDIGSNLDVLCSLRKREAVLQDMKLNPRKITGMFEVINHLWKEFYEDNYTWITEYTPYMTAFTPIVKNGKWYKVESESSVLLSPRLFADMVLPALQWQADCLDSVMFNLDGFDHARLLPEVLTLKGLHSVTWVPPQAMILCQVNLSKTLPPGNL